jgi:Fic family protein
MTVNQENSHIPLMPLNNPEDAHATRAAFEARIMNAADAHMEMRTMLQKAFPECQTVAEAIAQIDEIKKCYESFQPFDDVQMANLLATWDTEYTYESNRIEGNTLTLRETSLVINEGLTIAGKSMREHLEVVNHHAAVRLMRKMVADDQAVDVKAFLKLHSLILRTIDDKNAGFFRDVRVGIRGTNKIFPNPAKVPYLIEELFTEFQSDIVTLHPILASAKLHHRLVHIHPFADGNGRTSRLMQNLVLLKNGFVVSNLKGADSNRIAYYDALDAADNGDYSALNQLLIAEEKHALLRYLEMLSGNIGEGEQYKGAYFFERLKMA